MLLLSCRKIKKSFNYNTVLQDINFDVSPTDRIGLIGENGSGKTTLAEIIAGEKKPDSGQVLPHSKNPTIGYLSQGREENSSTEELHPGSLATSKQLGLEKVYSWKKERLENASGGEKTKLALAMIWDQNPNLLVLDEPTNHLDEQGIEWLIEKLSKFEGALLVISHDRYFLDRVTNKTMELKNGIVKVYPGNYSFFKEEKAHQEKTQKGAYEKEKKEQKKLKEEITRTKNWAKSGHDKSREKARENKKGGKEFFRARAAKKERQVQSKLKRLEKLKKQGTRKPFKEQSLNIDLVSPEKKGQQILELKEGAKAFGEKPLFSNSSFFLLRGEKTALCGPNGCGKSSLLKIICREDKLDQGELWLSPSAKIGYLPQEEIIPIPEETGFEVIARFPRGKREKVITLLARMGFPRQLLERPLSKLSYGERRRFELCHILLQEPDLLLLDEPTTHLDLNLRIALEDALKNYNGTLILICHDRYLVDSLCSSQVFFHDQVLSKKTMKKEQVPSPEKDDLMLIGARIAQILGELSRIEPDSDEYFELDDEFKKLITTKNQLKTELNSRLK